MFLNSWIALSVFLVCSCSYAASSPILGSFFSIYGEDDRKDFFEFKKDSLYSNLADSTVALFNEKQVTPLRTLHWMGSTWQAKDESQRTLIGKLFKDMQLKVLVPQKLTYPPRLPDGTINPAFVLQLMGRLSGLPVNPVKAVNYALCPGERFEEQPTGAFCSGTLIAPHLILTAGHCMRSEEACESTRFVFGYQMKENNQLSFSVPVDEVYSCKRVLIKELNTHSEVMADAPDFAIVELDREVPNHKPLELEKNQENSLEEETPLFIIGHPNGLPVKIGGGAVVIDHSDKNYFNANLDAFAGNSGSPVFNEKTGLIEGVLVAGTPDFEIDRKNECFRSARYKNRDKSHTERVTRGKVILERLKAQESFIY